jgi:thiamine pyrophosphokinase
MPAEECAHCHQPPADPLEVFVLHTLVFANGELLLPQAGVPQAELTIAADGGTAHCRALGIAPQVVIGDFDSLDASLRAGLEAGGARFVQHPARKDATDFELALLHAQAAGADRVDVLGGLGRRWDHSLANLLLAADSRFENMRITFLHGEQRLFVIATRTLLQLEIGSRLSLLPIKGDAVAVRTRGLEYPLANETLSFGSSRGVSNVVAAPQVEIDLLSGLLLCILSPADFG